MRLIYLLLLLLPVVASAGSGSGLVELEAVGEWNGMQLVFFFTSTHANKPSCNIYHQRWVLDLASERGKAQYSLLLAAQSSGKQVKVEGSGQCDVWYNSETVHWVGFPIDYSKYPD